MASAIPCAERIDGQLVYVVGDVHGRYDLLKDLLGQIAADVAARGAGRRPHLIFCGDYLDRGPESAQVVETLIWLARADRFELCLLKGNHEDVFLAFMDRPEAMRHWLKVGGRATLASYGVSPPEDLDDMDACRQAREALAVEMPAEHLRLIRTLRTIRVIGDYAFVHAGIRPGVRLSEQSDRDLMWIREGFLERAERFEKRIVHGHSWSSATPEVLPNRIGIDTGAFKTGVLSAVRIEDRELAILQAHGQGTS